MTRTVPFHDSLYRLGQVGAALGVQLVRLVEVIENNRYSAVPIEFASDGSTQQAEETPLTVTNLAEPADQTGQVPADTEAVALDVEGRWIVFLKPQPEQGPSATFPAKVVDSLGNAAYSVLEQVCTGVGSFDDKSGAQAVTAHNLAELSLGPGAAVDDGTIVMVTMLTDTGQPPAARYVFDHPAYAKYLD
ncbi:MAG: hypothetical protein MUP47_08440 [Phycisphaerae bacterium]|nr:hypothetical protein [Phycisphaerae bacterium]